MSLAKNTFRHQQRRFGGDTGTMSARWFLLLLVGFVLVDLAWTGLLSRLTVDMTFTPWWHYLVFALVMFIIALAGVFVTAASETAVGSRFGSAVMSGGLGLLLGPTLGYFTETDIVKSLVGLGAV